MGPVTKDKGYRSEIAGPIPEMMSDAHDAGAVSRATLHTFDEACLAPVPTLAGDEIRAIREREHVSQPVFAAYLNVSRNLVSDWERGVKRPGGPALRLPSIIQRKGLQAVAQLSLSEKWCSPSLGNPGAGNQRPIRYALQQVGLCRFQFDQHSQHI